MNDTYLQNMVGVNFKQNPSLRDRYDEYLQSRSVLYILHFSCFSIHYSSKDFAIAHFSPPIM